MALWVRTQDRFELAKINSVYAGYQEKDKDYVIMGQKHNGGARLGSYATKERALEVLDEIQNILNLKDMYKYDRELVLKSWENIDEEQVEIVRQQMSVYEMPEV